MSNFLNNGFTDLNGLTNFDSDEIRTNKLYVNGVQILANSSNFDIIDCSKLICQNDISANTIFAVTSIQNVPVAKYAFLLNVSSDIQSQFNNITNNYPTKTQVANNFNTYNTQVVNTYVTKTTYNAFVTTLNNTFPNYALISSLSNYALISSLSDYALISSLSDYALISSLSNYALISSLSNYALISSLSSYVTNSSLTTSLSNYVTNTSLSSQLLSYVTNSSLTTSLSNYVTNTSLSSQLSDYCLQSNYNLLKSQADGLSLLLSNTQYINGFGLNWYGNMNVFGQLILTSGTNNYLDVKSIIFSLPTTYVSITSFNQTLNSYATKSYVDGKVSNLQDQIDDVKLQADINSGLIATNGTSIAGLITASAAQQTQLTALAASVGIVQGGLTTAETQITTLQTKTSLLNVVGGHTQFSGSGIKVMNGLVYTSIINNDGSSDFYGLMTLRQGLAVTNGIQSDRVTTADLISNGPLQVTGVSSLSTTNITGNVSINGVPTQTPNVTTPSNLTITNGKLTISGTSSNIINNDTIFNGGITATNLSLVNPLSLNELQCNDLNFINSSGGNSLKIGNNGGSLFNPNSITIGNSFSTTYLNGLVLFTGSTFNMSSYINQIS